MSDDAAKLRRALTAWRRSLHPRWADVIDRLDEAARRGLGPVRASSAPALTAALVAAVKTKDAVEVGRVLASPWPKAWQAQQPIIAALREAPPDPRISRRLAELVDQAPSTFHSRGARSLWWQVFGALTRHRDLRQLQLLESQARRSKSRYYREYAEDWEAGAVKALRKLPPPALSKADAQLLSALEASFAGAVSGDRKRASSGAALLEQVWAHPRDLAARSVYGDWLLEQSDPRGELIALQLGAPSEQAERKAQALIERHWKKWLAPLSDWFARPPRFEAGFPVAGVARRPSVHDGRERLEPLLARPEWSTFRQLSLEWDRLLAPAELLALPRFAALEHLGNVGCEDVVALAKARARLVAIDLDSPDGDEELPAGVWDAFPKLERVASSFDAARAIVAGLGKRALPEVHLTLWSGLSAEDADAGWKALDASTVGRVSLGFYDGVALVTREGPGKPFTKVEVRDAASLDVLAQALPPQVMRLEHSVERLLELEADDMERIEARLARYRSLEVKQLPVATQAPHAQLTLEGFEVFSEARVLEAWALLKAQFGVAPDRFQIGYSGRPRAFIDVDLVKAARNSRVTWLYLDREGSPGRIEFSRRSVRLCAPVGDAARFVDAILATFTLAKAESVYLQGGKGSLVVPASQFEKRRAEVISYLRTVRA